MDIKGFNTSFLLNENIKCVRLLNRREKVRVVNNLIKLLQKK